MIKFFAILNTVLSRMALNGERHLPIVIMAIRNFLIICVSSFSIGAIVPLVLLALYKLVIDNNWILFALLLSDFIACILVGVRIVKILFELEEPAPQLQLQLPFYLIDRQHG